MGKFKRRQYIENMAGTLMGQLSIKQGAGLDSCHNDSNLALSVRGTMYGRVLTHIRLNRRMNEMTLMRIVCCAERPAIPIGERYRHGSRFREDLLSAKIRCPLDYVRGPNWLKDFEEKSGLEIMRHIAATVIVAAMYDVMNKRKNGGIEVKPLPSKSRRQPITSDVCYI